jgi:alginate biosynthesis protein Alg44
VISASLESTDPLPIEAIGRPIGVRIDQFQVPDFKKIVERFSES